jgi:hypothetical protein
MNGWHGSACSAMHMQQRTAVVLQHAADCDITITVAATIKDVQLE